ncbi:uncharacterized protein [Penaeus vannamei]|uniref:uncharacterized protein isoform X3 n=1 Tax=Penaeus vannamei TaxID=6689 RepID=UPI00387F6961
MEEAPQDEDEPPELETCLATICPDVPAWIHGRVREIHREAHTRTPKPNPQQLLPIARDVRPPPLRIILLRKKRGRKDAATQHGNRSLHLHLRRHRVCGHLDSAAAFVVMRDWANRRGAAMPSPLSLLSALETWQ